MTTKGGRGPNTGKTARTFVVTLPDGTTRRRRTYFDGDGLVGYAYQHGGQWYLATLGDPGNKNFASYTECPATRMMWKSKW